jgi:hypothetical protein
LFLSFFASKVINAPCILFRNPCKIFCLFICLLFPCLSKCLIFSYPWIWDLLFCWCQSNKIYKWVLMLCSYVFLTNEFLCLNLGSFCFFISVPPSVFCQVLGEFQRFFFSFFLVVYVFFPFNLCISLVIVNLNYDFWIVCHVSNLMANLHLRLWTYSLDSLGIHCF